MVKDDNVEYYGGKTNGLFDYKIIRFENSSVLSKLNAIGLIVLSL